MPLNIALLKKDDSITTWVGKALMCVSITNTDLIKVKRARLFMANGVQVGFLSPIKIPTKRSRTDPYTKIPPTS
jgi:hypothetical protein